MRTPKVLLAALAAVSVALAACGGSDSNSNSNKASTSTPAKLSGSIDVWIMDPGSPKIQSVVKGYGTSFEAQHPGTKVNIEFVPWAQAHDKFTTSIAGGKTPDIAEMGTTWTPEFADEGAFEQVAKPPSGKYVSSLIDAATLDGKVWGKPWYAGSRALIYRKDVLKKAGVDDVLALSLLLLLSLPPQAASATLTAASAASNTFGVLTFPPRPSPPAGCETSDWRPSPTRRPSPM